ncbi:hypothetical protein GF374_00945 [Candidatus Woesearchaeota archaeon]|nr:hypothetical protein [Candidatus Woesearchaeota archaeon]
MEREQKKNLSIRLNSYIMIKIWNLEAIQGKLNYTVCVFRNIDYIGTPTRVLRAYVCNSSYENEGVRVDLSSNCIYINSLTTADLNNIYYSSRNSSYSKKCYSVENGMLAGINLTDYLFIFYGSLTDAANPYVLKYANGSSGTNVSFKNTNIAWTSTNAINYTLAAGTPDVWLTSIMSGDQFQFGTYVEDNLGNNYTNFTFFTDDIGDVNYPITSPNIKYIHKGILPTLNGCNYSIFDSYLNGTYKDNITIHVNTALDPDACGTVNHTLYLCNTDGTVNYTINISFYSPTDDDVHVFFDTNNVPDDQYKLNVTAVADDNPSDVQSHLIYDNFTIDNTAPNTTLNSPAGNYANDTGSPINITFNCSVTENNDLLNISLYLTDYQNQSFSLNQTTNISGTSNTTIWTLELTSGDYTWNCLATDLAGNIDWGTNRSFKLNYTAPSQESETGNGGGSTGGTLTISEPEEEVEEAEIVKPDFYIGDFDKTNSYTKTMQPNQVHGFTYKKINHTLEITKIKNDSVRFVLRSEPIFIDLKIGETKRIDLDKNTVDDIQLTLNSIKGQKISFTLSLIQEPVSTPEFKKATSSQSGILVLLVFILIFGFIFFRRKKKK